MAEIKKSNGRDVIDYMARDYDSLLRSMRDLTPDKLPEWKEYESEADFGNVLLQLFAHMGDILSYYQDRIANESFLGTARTRGSIIHHLRLIGYKLSTAAPASTTLKLTVPADCSETITISRGDAFATKSQKDKPSVRFEYSRGESITIDWGNIDPLGNKKYFAGVPVEEGRLIEDEILGESDGTPNQRFPLAHPGLILRSLGQGQKVNKDIILITEMGETIEEWMLQESLAFSREGQKDFVIEIDEEDRATVIFGNNNFGAIPPSGAIIKATYRVGGGLHGNVVKDTIQTIVDAPQLALLGVKVTNTEPATGGAERESIEHAVMHAPNVFRSLKRSVTAEDYKALALDFKGVGKVRAEATNWNTVKLFVAPEGGGHVNDVLEANLLAYFEDKRPLSTIIEIKDVDYVNIYVTAKIELESYYSKTEMKEKVKQAAGSLLSFENVDFAKTIYLSKFYEEIEDIEGVKSVFIKEFRKESWIDEEEKEAKSTGKIKLRANEIPKAPDPTDDPHYAGGIKLEVEGGIENGT
jgi:hypothetical protein